MTLHIRGSACKEQEEHSTDSTTVSPYSQQEEEEEEIISHISSSPDRAVVVVTGRLAQRLHRGRQRCVVVRVTVPQPGQVTLHDLTLPHGLYQFFVPTERRRERILVRNRRHNKITTSQPSRQWLQLSNTDLILRKYSAQERRQENSTYGRITVKYYKACKEQEEHSTDSTTVSPYSQQEEEEEEIISVRDRYLNSVTSLVNIKFHLWHTHRAVVVVTGRLAQRLHRGRQRCVVVRVTVPQPGQVTLHDLTLPHGLYQTPGGETIPCSLSVKYYKACKEQEEHSTDSTTVSPYSQQEEEEEEIISVRDRYLNSVTSLVNIKFHLWHTHRAVVVVTGRLAQRLHRGRQRCVVVRVTVPQPGQVTLHDLTLSHGLYQHISSSPDRAVVVVTGRLAQRLHRGRQRCVVVRVTVPQPGQVTLRPDLVSWVVPGEFEIK
ncbi:hypothetical protein O3P69_011741 [Scylla paramamosain]|uniref:Uncharacterized protein n=1 Tax=Scylla paramamosain TaxID=85552 RepID=A0AAW0SFG3_SCYPA